MSLDSIALRNIITQSLRTELENTLVTGEDLGSAAQSITGTLGNIPIEPGTVVFTDPDATAEDVVDQGDGTGVSASDGGTATIDYKTGDFTVNFGVAPGVTNNTADYRHGDWRNFKVTKNSGGHMQGDSMGYQITSNDDDILFEVRVDVVDMSQTTTV